MKNKTQASLINEKIKEFLELYPFKFIGDRRKRYVKKRISVLVHFLRQALKEVSDRSVEAVRVDLEKQAELEHLQWSHWAIYMLNPENHTNRNVSRWLGQAHTDYKELTEDEKEKDRVWARQAISDQEEKIKSFKETK